MKRNKLIVGIGLLLIGVFALHGVATAQEYVYAGKIELGFSPEKIAVAGDTLYVTDGLSSVYKIVGDGDATPWLTNLRNPYGVAVDTLGDVYVAENNTNSSKIASRIQKFNSEGDSLGEVSGSSSWRPYDIAVYGPPFVYIADRSHQCIWQCDGMSLPPWTSWGTWGTPGSDLYPDPDQFSSPSGIAVNQGGNVYVADTVNHRIQRRDSYGSSTSTTAWGYIVEGNPSSGTGNGHFDSPEGIVVGPDGNVFVADTGNHRIQKFNGNGGFITKWGLTVEGNPSSGSGNGEFNSPSDVAVGSDSTVYVADRGNQRIQIFSRDPVFLIQEMIDKVLSFNLNQGIVNSLDAKLDAALHSVDAATTQQTQTAINQLEAFINAVEAQRGNKLTEEQANELNADANAIIALLQL